MKMPRIARYGVNGDPIKSVTREDSETGRRYQKLLVS